MMASADYRLQIVTAAGWFRRINDTAPHRSTSVGILS
jgi:hypothetical protein